MIDILLKKNEEKLKMKKVKEINAKSILEYIDELVDKYKLNEQAKEDLIKLSKKSYCLGSADLFKIMQKSY